jgi:hypothetical protein
MKLVRISGLTGFGLKRSVHADRILFRFGLIGFRDIYFKYAVPVREEFVNPRLNSI